MSKHIHDSEDSNSNFIADNTNSHPHSSKNFVSQTESAQILLSLACSYSQKEGLGSQTNNIISNESDLLNEKTIIDAKINNNILFSGHNLLMTTNSLITTSASDADVKTLNNVIMEQQLTKRNLLQNKQEQNDGSVFSKYCDVFTPSPCGSPVRTDSNKSLLAKLLTRDNQGDTTKGSQYTENYKNLYDEEQSEEIDKNQNNSVTFDKSKNFDLQTGIILQYPFLIETNEGYVPFDSMLNVFENGEMFDPSGSKALKIIPKEDVISPGLNSSIDKDEVNFDSNSIQMKNDAEPYKDIVLERIKQDTEEELRNDPEAVVLSLVTEDGRLEKYVLPSADIKRLKEINDLRKKRKQNLDAVEMPHIEVESPLSHSDTSLITRIINCGVRVENAISKLPFKKSLYRGQSLDEKSESNSVNFTSSISDSSTVTNENILEDASLTVDAHQHENMFEELDNQFNMDCSIENIQREYVAYEEASKNETQLEHNYYANAMKDEEEECVVINDNYDLRSMMMIGESLENGDELVEGSIMALSSNTNHKLKNVNTLQVISAEDVYLNDCESQKKEKKRNGFIEKGSNVFNGKCDLILNNDALVSSMLNATSETRTVRMTNGSIKTCKELKSNDLKRSATRTCFNNVNTLPFKSVKSTSTRMQFETKPKRTYKRKSNSFAIASPKKRNENSCLNGVLCPEDNLVEEIIVDEIS